MEALDLDGCIRDKLKETEHFLPEDYHEQRDRIWKVVSHQLETRPKIWLRVAVLIAMLLLPAGILLVQNSHYKREITSLQEKIILLDKESGELERALALNQKERQNIPPDTVRLVQQVIVQTKRDTVEILKYVKDTVVVFRETELTYTDRDSIIIPESGTIAVASEWVQSPPLVTEYILSNAQRDGKNSSRQSRSISIVFGSSNVRKVDSQMTGIKAKL